jgi:uncharacterized protein (TIGR02145 family)
MKSFDFKSIVYFSIFCLLFTYTSCEKDRTPQVTTLSVTDITAVSAKCGGNVTDPGAKKVISRGIVWSTSSTPTIEDHEGITLSGFGGGVFACPMTNLLPNTKYYVRAFATNIEGTGYGDFIQFTTLNGTSTPVLPTIVTSGVSNITLTGATCGGDVTNTGGDPVIARGVCWSTTHNPTTASTKTIDGSGPGLFVSTLTNLQPNVTYYVRAYATNSVGTAYGNEVAFLTSSSGISYPSVSTSPITNPTSTSAVGGGNVISDGGATVTARGVCWGPNPGPTTSNPHTTDGNGIGVFVSNITGLQPGTTYYVRAYATNSQGTSYGLDVQFSTTSTSIVAPSVTTTPITSFTQTTATGGGDVTSDGGSTVTARGVCWSLNPNPSLSNSFTSDGTGLGTFISNISGLQSGQTYYVRAYATNSVGTGYGTQVQFTTASPPAFPVYDIDGNGYDTVHIGTQIWLKQNLRTTKYNDGSPIPQYTTNSTWVSLSTGGMCWYNNDSANYATIYGALYNWYSTNSSTNGGKNICPFGWHVPYTNDFTELANYLGGVNIAGGKLKLADTVFWSSPNTGATNVSNFSALAAGERDAHTGHFEDMGQYTHFWSNSSFSASNSYYLGLSYSNSIADITYNNKEYGWSVRCVKD